jgi:hypothetical protein
MSGAGRLQARQGQANDAEAFRRQLLDAFARGDRHAGPGWCAIDLSLMPAV